jgi:hypothetical protein
MSSRTEAGAGGVLQVLRSEFEGVSPDAIQRVVEEAVAQFEHARVREFVPLLVYRESRERLLAADRIAP